MQLSDTEQDCICIVPVLRLNTINLYVEITPMLSKILLITTIFFNFIADVQNYVDLNSINAGEEDKEARIRPFSHISVARAFQKRNCSAHYAVLVQCTNCEQCCVF